MAAMTSASGGDSVAAPDWHIASWLNTPQPLSLSALRGRVVLLHAFLMLCPGCVQFGLPQAQRVHERLGGDAAVVVGLHTVFEHHVVMTPAALSAFVHEYRWSFPIGVDQPSSDGAVPLTMAAYGLRGTPTLVLIDRAGRIRLHRFGHIDDLALGAAIARVQAEDQ
jgi:thiol-disulfide isomerase/thioredoxin